MIVGCFLSRFGETDGQGRSRPPAETAVDSWSSAYLCFYRALAGGRSIRQFGHALKNTRDEFDGFFENGRVGWRASGDERPARPLTPDMQRVFDDHAALERGAYWSLVVPHYSSDWLTVVPDETESAEHHHSADGEIVSRSEGGRRVIMSSRVERDARLRAQAIQLHGTQCAVCDFDFGAVYGAWGHGFCEVHHLAPLAEGGEERTTNPLRDLAVLCANCHRMIHRKRGTTLTVEELRLKMATGRRTD